MGKELNIINLKNALQTLELSFEALSENKISNLEDIIKDSCVQRFEYTFEIAWKLMKKYLKIIRNKSEQELTINNIFRFSEGYGLIENWENWRKYCEKRNATSHEYNLEKSRELIQIIPDFISDTKILIKNLEKEIHD